jgi:hypothetical protein
MPTFDHRLGAVRKVSTRSRYEAFGGILALNRPAATVYVHQAYMRELGYAGSPLWASGQTYLSAPVTAHFAVTHRCPLGCRTCYNASGAARPDELSTDEAKAVLDTLAGMGVFTMAFGGGEPLARPDLFELAQSKGNYPMNGSVDGMGAISSSASSWLYKNIGTILPNGCTINGRIIQSAEGFPNLRHQSFQGFELGRKAVTIRTRGPRTAKRKPLESPGSRPPLTRIMSMIAQTTHTIQPTRGIVPSNRAPGNSHTVNARVAAPTTTWTALKALLTFVALSLPQV